MNLKLISFYVIGASVGGYIGSRIADYVIEKYMRNDEPQSELSPEELGYMVQLEEEPEAEAEVEPEAPAEISVKSKKAKKRKAKDFDDEDQKDPNGKRNYGRYYDSIEKPPLGEIVTKFGYGLKRTLSNGPRVISLEEYSNNPGTFETETLTYWTIDDILSNSKEEVIPDRDSVIGKGTLKRFGDMSEDPEIVYVRDENKSIDYEIIRNELSYAEVVGGFLEEDDLKKKIPKTKGKMNG